MSTQKTEYMQVGYKKNKKTSKIITFSVNVEFHEDVVNAYHAFADANPEIHVSFRDYCRMVFRSGLAARGGK